MNVKETEDISESEEDESSGELEENRKIAVVLAVDTNRPGNKADVKRLMTVLPNLGYRKIICPENPTRQEMVDSLKRLHKLQGSYGVTKDYKSFSYLVRVSF